MRDKCIDMLYEHVTKIIPIERSIYEATLIGWDIQPIFLNDEFVGVIMLRDHEIHVCITPELAVKSGRALIRECLIKRLETFGYLITLSLKSDVRSIQFIERLGFHKTGEDENLIHFRIEHTKFH